METQKLTLDAVRLDRVALPSDAVDTDLGLVQAVPAVLLLSRVAV